MSANTTNNRSHSTTAAEVNPVHTPTSAATGWPQRSHGRHVARNGMCDSAQDAPGMPSGFLSPVTHDWVQAFLEEPRGTTARNAFTQRVLLTTNLLRDCSQALVDNPDLVDTAALRGFFFIITDELAALRTLIETATNTSLATCAEVA